MAVQVLPCRAWFPQCFFSSATELEVLAFCIPRSATSVHAYRYCSQHFWCYPTYFHQKSLQMSCEVQRKLPNFSNPSEFHLLSFLEDCTRYHCCHLKITWGSPWYFCLWSELQQDQPLAEWMLFRPLPGAITAPGTALRLLLHPAALIACTIPV